MEGKSELTASTLPTAYKGRDIQQAVAQALEAYEGGKEIEDAAGDIGVPARTLYRWLANNAQDQWHEAQRGRVLADSELAKKRRDEASDTLNALKEQLETEGVKEPAERNWRLAHAREVLRAADQALDHQKWLLERLLKRIYGQESGVADVAGRISITLNVGDSPRRDPDIKVVDHNP